MDGGTFLQKKEHIKVKRNNLSFKQVDLPTGGIII
jgi:hypothetical protein